MVKVVVVDMAKVVVVDMVSFPTLVFLDRVMLTFFQEEEVMVEVEEEEDTRARHDSGWEGCKR